jgi:hypothetical protein
MADALVRDLHGYGRRGPLAAWPGAARVAVSFVLNYEEGGERNVLDGDAHAENYLVPEVVGLPPIGGRSRIVEDLFEYGSRAGFWRVLRLFEERGLHFTCWAVGLALKRNPDAGHAMAEAGHEVAGHSWRWTDYSGMPEDEERDHIRQTVATIRDICSAPPLAACRTGFVICSCKEKSAANHDCRGDDDGFALWHRGDIFCRRRLFLAAGECRQRSQPAASANIRLMFQAMVTRFHSPRTLSSPRSRNWRNPITDLMIPNTGSGVCLRNA